MGLCVRWKGGREGGPRGGVGHEDWGTRFVYSLKLGGAVLCHNHSLGKHRLTGLAGSLGKRRNQGGKDREIQFVGYVFSVE